MPDYMGLVSTAIAFIDSALLDLPTLRNGIAIGTEVITLDAGRDGVSQIAQALENRSNIKSIHIISHGRPASLQLGAIELNLTNLKIYAKQLQLWGRSLAENAEILLYGCEVAAGEKGANFVQQISQLTQAKIAASSTPVGSAAMGGDWELDYTTGEMSSEWAIDPATRATYQFAFGRTLYDGTNYSPLPPTSAPIPGIGTAAGTQLVYGQVPLPVPVGSAPLAAGAYSPNTGINTASATAANNTRGYAGYTNYLYSPPPLGAGTFSQLNPSFPALNLTNGYSVSFNVAVTAETSLTDNRAGFSIIAISSDAPKGIELGFTNRNLGPNGGIFAQLDNPLFTRGESANFNISNATDYKLVVRGTTYSLFAGGTPLLTNQSLRNYGTFDPLTSQPALPFNPYTQPNFLFFGDDTDQASATFTLGNISVNNFPVAANDTYSVVHDKVLNIAAATGVLSNDTDANSDALTATVVTGPTKGTIVLNPTGDFIYTPQAGFVGTDSFTYTVSDGTDANTLPTTVNINITNSAPIAQPDNYSVARNQVLNVTAPGFLSNDSDADLDPLSAVLLTSPTKGAIVFKSTGDFTYTPNAGFVGTDTFTYSVSDGVATAPGTVNLNITNNAPIAQPDNYTTPNNTPLTVAGPGVLSNDNDSENDSLTAILVANPTQGAIVFNTDGSFSYTPNTGFAGTDSFTYKANDGQAESAIATVSIIVDNPPTPTPTPTPTGTPTPTPTPTGTPTPTPTPTGTPTPTPTPTGTPTPTPTPTGTPTPTPTETPTEETPTEETPTEETPTEETPTPTPTETPTEETPTEETPTEETPTEETPTETPTEETPTETPTEETPTEETPTEETPTEETPIEETPIEETPTEETPTEETPTEETPIEETPIEETPIEETPIEETPIEETPTEETPTEETPTEETPTEETPTPTPTPDDRDCICEQITLPSLRSILVPNPTNNTLNGTNGDNVIFGTNLNDAINGLGGNDILRGEAGNDNIYGGLIGNFTIDPNTDKDILFGGFGNDYLNGNEGNDTIAAGQNDDVAIGGKGDDWISGDLGNDTAIGAQGDDYLFGGSFDPTGRDLLFGGGGNDSLNGEDAADTLSGDEGDDTLSGGKGNDVLVGGTGNDLLLGDRGSDTLCGGDGDDTIFGDSPRSLNGVPDSLCGGAGNDLMFGNGGDDQLWGDEGNDTLYGGKGDDTLTGGSGNNTLSGGAGGDRFVLSAGTGNDVIADFTKGEDLLVLTGGITFNQLSITPGANDPNAVPSAIVRINNTNQIFAIINGVQANLITSNDFTQFG
jgi:Domain of unknown function (DUF4347)/Bacterial Ig domain/RTX calcium-binding nonapeptide repeat (4 copies)